MSVSGKRIVPWFAFAIASGVALFFAHKYDVAHPRITLEDTLPDHQAFVVSIDADRFRGDPVFASLETPEALVARLSPCGFDVSTRVHRAVFVVPEGEEKGGSFAVAATLSITPAEIEACGKLLRDGTPPTLDRNFYVTRKEERSLAYKPTENGEGIVLFGDTDVVSTMLDAAQGKHARLATQSGHAHVRAVLAAEREGVVFSAVLPRDLRERLRKDLGENESQMAAILSVELAGIGVAPDGKGGVDVSGAFFCDTKDESTRVRDWAERQITQLKRDLGLKLLLGGTLDGLSLKVSDKRVAAHVSVPHEILERVYAFLLAQAGDRIAPKMDDSSGDPPGRPPGFSP